MKPNWLVNARTLPPSFKLNRITRSAPPSYPTPVAIRPLMMALTDEERDAIVTAAAAAARGVRQDVRAKSCSSIGIDFYKSGVDDFDDWVELFEKAVDLATRAPTEAERHQLYKDWLSLRLDKAAGAILTQAEARTHARAQALNPPRTATWVELKEELKILLMEGFRRQVGL